MFKHIPQKEVGRLVRKIILRIGIVFLSVILISLCYWIIVEIPNHPSEPKASGDFPDAPVWLFEADSRVIATPKVKDKVVFIRTVNSIYALDILNGAVIWQAKSPGNSDLGLAPQTQGDYLIVAEKNAGIAAFSIHDGDLFWRDIFSSVYGQSPKVTIIDDIALENNHVYAARRNLFISSYEMTSGKTLEMINVPDRTILSIEADPKTIYVSAGHYVKAYDAESDALLWQYDFGSDIGAAVLQEDVLYLAFPFGKINVIALDLETRKIKWKIDDTQIEGIEIRNLTLIDDILFAGAEKLLAMSKSDGRVLWITKETDDLESPVIINGNVYVRNTQTTLYSFDLLSGKETGRLLLQENTPMKRQPERGPAAAAALLIVPFGDNRVYSYLP